MKLRETNCQLTGIRTELQNLKHEVIKTFADGELTLIGALPLESISKTSKSSNIDVKTVSKASGHGN